MWWTNVIIVSLILQSLFIISIDGNARRRRRQAPGSAYGANTNSGNPSAGYVNPANTNYYGTGLNNQGGKDLYGNSLIPSNTGNSMNTMGLNNQQQLQQQQQQQQLYGTNGQALPNSGGNFYSAGGTNQLVRDANGNLVQSGPASSSLYPSGNSQLGYPGNTNQLLTNKDIFNTPTNTNNNNQYGLNGNLSPNSNAYNAQLGANNNNVWPNTNNNANGANAYYPNRDAYNTNNNNHNNKNNNNAYTNPSSPYFYNDSHRVAVSCLIILLSIITTLFFHI